MWKTKIRYLKINKNYMPSTSNDSLSNFNLISLKQKKN
jgi:hypothetical protein